MVSIKKNTPLTEGLYLIHDGMWQIRVRGTQHVISSLPSFDHAVRAGVDLVRLYRNTETITSRLQHQVSKAERERRSEQEREALVSQEHKEWVSLVSVKEIPLAKAPRGIKILF